MKRAAFTAFTTVILAFGVVPVAQSAPYSLSADGATVVRLEPQGTVAATSLDTSLLNAGWSATAGTGGSTSVTTYDAKYRSGFGGAEFKALYDNAATLGTGESLEWIQVIETNVPLGGATSPYLDNAGKPTKPFYTYTAENRDTSLPANQLNFYDFPKRDPSSLATVDPDPIEWNADLYPVIWDGGTSVEVRDGVSWGWNMKKATVGSTTGTFVNPTPATAVVSGVGTNAFSWGVSSDPSSVAFVGEAFDTEPRTPFTLGRLTFHNGVIDTGTGADGVDFNVAISFDNVAEENFVLTTAFAINNTLNTSDPNASADFLSIGDFGFTFHVLENATASVDVIGMLTTGLDAIASGTDMPSGADLFSTGPFDPTGGYMLSIVGLSDPSSGGFVRRVPEPSTITLCALGLVALFLLGRGRNARRGSA